MTLSIYLPRITKELPKVCGGVSVVVYYFAPNDINSILEPAAKSSGISPLTQLNNFIAQAQAMATMANQPAQQQGPPQQGFLSTQSTGIYS